MKYLPFLDGKYSVAPGLLPIRRVQHERDKFIFQIDEEYDEYLHNKLLCREENIRKYFCEEKLYGRTCRVINQYILKQLLEEYPGRFFFNKNGSLFNLVNMKTGEQIFWDEDFISVSGKRYISLFDALSCQVQEDFAVCQLHEDKDWMAAIHLCAPNHWAAEDKIGRSFDIVHAPVAGMEKTMPHYFKMLQTIVHRGAFTRFAWGIATDKRLNHHPKPPEGADPVLWCGRSLDETTNELYVRVERQNLIGFIDVNAFLFTIRTYFYSIYELSVEEKAALMAAVESMPDASLLYKGLYGKKEILRKLLQQD